MALTQLFANARLVQDVGVGGIYQNLPPFSDLAPLTEALGSALVKVAPSLEDRFRLEHQALSLLLASGGTPAQFRDLQRKIGILLNRAETTRLLAETGWDLSSRRLFLGDEEASHLVDVVDASIGTSLERLSEFVAIPSVSFPDSPSPHVWNSAEWTRQAMEKVGFQNVHLITKGEILPSVYGEIMVDPRMPTILLYAHHDVKPEGNIREWETKPYEARVVKDRLYGRGAADDKAGVVAVLSLVEAYHRAGMKLPVNIKFFVEGEEEISSPHLGILLDEMGDRLKADLVLLLDSGNVESGLPTITTSTRGVQRFKIKVKTATKPDHSGMVGGAILNADLVLGRILGKLLDPGKWFQLVIPGLTDQLTLSLADRAAISGVPFDEESFRAAANILEGPIWGDSALSVYERMWRGFAVNVVRDGPQQGRGMTVPEAQAEVELRVPPGFDTRDSVEKLVAFLLEGLPPWPPVMVSYPSPANNPWVAKLDHPLVGLLETGLSLGYGTDAALRAGCGGAIGFLPYFDRFFPRTPLIPLGVEDPHTRAHAPNESLNVADFAKTIRSLALFLALIARDYDPKSWRVAS